MSWVYVFDFGDRVKVGYSTNLKARQQQIQRTLKKKVVRTFSIEAPVEVETLAHDKLEPFRIQGEYYTCSFDMACVAVKTAKKFVQGQPKSTKPSVVHFTMVMDRELAMKLDFIRKRNGRSRIKEIENVCKEYVRLFEETVDKIELKDP